MYGETEEELLANAKRHRSTRGTQKKHGMKRLFTATEATMI
jgi:hypothetical protein